MSSPKCFAEAPPTTGIWRWRSVFRFFGLGLMLLGLAPCPRAHESRPAYLEINETGPGRYDLLWRTPLLSGQCLPVVLQFLDGVREVTKPGVRELTDSRIERRRIEATGGLAGKRINFVGLQSTLTDVLVRLQLPSGAYSTTLVHPSRPWIEIAAQPSLWAVTGTYLSHGVEHILFGYDHLLFVLALLLIVRDGRRLIATVTAFTAAHSITLALATLRVVQVPGPPVEASIALSIVLLAGEIIRLQRGEASLTAQRPWLVAFAFGLLHGFGFASGLREIGLPPGDIPLALFTFNVGVEAGQLAFVSAVYGLVLAFRRLARFRTRVDRLRPATAYTIGTLAAFWFIDRVAGFWW